MYAEVYKWFTETSGLGLAEQTRKRMQPEQASKEDAVADAIGSSDLAWTGEVWLREHGTTSAATIILKVTSCRFAACLAWSKSPTTNVCPLSFMVPLPLPLRAPGAGGWQWHGCGCHEFVRG